MIYDVSAIATLAQQCAPEVATEAVVPLVITESGGDPLRINVNRGPRLRARSSAAGAELVRHYVAAGYTVDIGLAQVNSSNLARLGVPIEQAFEPCTNLRLASTLLREGYDVAHRHYRGLNAIWATYSLYNTGTLSGGFRNGYVRRVWSAAGKLGSIAAVPPPPSPQRLAGTGRVASVRGRPDDDAWPVGQTASNDVEVFK